MIAATRGEVSLRADARGPVFVGRGREMAELQAGLEDAIAGLPSWTTTRRSWPLAVEPIELYLRAGGRLDSSPPAATEAEDTYLYPLPASTMESNFALQTRAGWQVPTAPGGFVAYTTPPLEADLEIFGAGSADLWISSTAPDTDIQVTVTEVRPDDQERYVQRGWLRASHRKLDATRTTVLRPFHTHLRQHAEPLTPLEPTLLRVEIRPFGHVFRMGSALRLYVEAPTGITGLVGLAYLPTPSRNTVLHEPGRESRIVLGRVSGGVAQGPLPPCALGGPTQLSQPCRTNLIPVPGE